MLLALPLALVVTKVLGGIAAETTHVRVRCPRCRWRPSKADRWFCECGHTWNTFETRGLCPACQKQWTHTECLRCSEWSLHEDWYEADEPGPSAGR